MTPVPQLKEDIEALSFLFSPGHPPKRLIRPSDKAKVVYGFRDASGTRFGATFQVKGTLMYSSGQWESSWSEESSNYRELRNLILTLEEAQANGDLYNTEVFVFTDNSMAERAFYNGTSSSRTLFYLVLKLQKLQMHQELMIHFVHVSGRRMMAQGTDGLSRGFSLQGALRGTLLLEFVPLHQDPV